MYDVRLRDFDPDRDLKVVQDWLQHRHVTRWWGEPADSIADLGQRRPDEAAIILADRVPVGYLCWQQPSRDELEAAGLAGLPGDIVDMDILIGERDLLGRGIGSRAILLLTERLANQGVHSVGYATSIHNTLALKAARKLGFRAFQDFAEDGKDMRYLVKTLRDR